MIELGNILFPMLYQFENGLRLSVHYFLSECYGSEWWTRSLQTKLPHVYKYAEDQRSRLDAMPWIGASAAVEILPVHLVTLGQIEEIVKRYSAECIPELFPTIEFFLGHMDVIKRVRNLYSHMFPCISYSDCVLAKREIRTLATHINDRLKRFLTAS